MRIICYFLFTLMLTPCCRAENSGQIYYYHGQIVENQGAQAVSKQFGRYEYDNIVQKLKASGHTVHAEVRKKNTDVEQYATLQATHIKEQIGTGISAKDITLIGASKGARIVIAIQNRLQNSEIKSVLLAGMFSSVVNDKETQLYGKVLSIYDKSDSWLVSSTSLVDRSKSLTVFKEIVVDKNLKHGLLFKPYDDWLLPALDWAS